MRKTPYFLISQNKIDDNIKSFQVAMTELWQNHIFAYSVKTNSLPWVLEHLKDKGIFAEVVSDEEYELALLCGYDDSQIIFNGPIKGEEIFKRACQNGAYVNLDSKKDLELLKKYGSNKSNIGLRININPSIFDANDIGYEKDGFRFGFSDESNELINAINIIKTICGDRKIGLHLHCNSVTRSKNVYISIAKYAKKIIRKYNLDVSYIDIGGGFFGGVPGKTTPFEYISAIKSEFESVIDISNTTLIIEPGSAVVGSAVDLYTSVVDTKDTVSSRIVTTDGSRIHIDPLWKKEHYNYKIERIASANKRIDKQIICGYTCMDHDRLMVLKDEHELQIGDKIIYRMVGAYSMTFGGMFIRYYPDVYVKLDKHYPIKVRSGISVQEYYDIQNN